MEVCERGEGDNDDLNQRARFFSKRGTTTIVLITSAFILKKSFRDLSAKNRDDDNNLNRASIRKTDERSRGETKGDFFFSVEASFFL